MHIYDYIHHPYTTLHLTGRAPQPVEAMQIQQHLLAQDAVLGRLIGAVVPGTGDASAVGGAGMPGLAAEAPGTSGA
jgi:hypothetical protein